MPKKKRKSQKMEHGYELSTKIGKTTKKVVYSTKMDAEKVAKRLKQSGLGFITKIKKIKL